MNDSKTEIRNHDHAYGPAGPCCGQQPWAAYRRGMGNADSGRFGGMEMPHMMAGCLHHCWYFLLLAVILGGILLALGCYLGPVPIRACWMVGAPMMVMMAMMAVMGLLAVLVMWRMAAGHGWAGCRGPRPGRNH